MHICMYIHPICTVVHAQVEICTKLPSSSSPIHSLKLIAPLDAVGHIVNYCLSLLHLRHHTGTENSLQTDGELLEMNLQVCEKMDLDFMTLQTQMVY